MSKNCYKINIYLLFYLLIMIKKLRVNNNGELKIKKVIIKTLFQRCLIFSNFQGDITVLAQHDTFERECKITQTRKQKLIFRNNKAIIRERKGIKMLEHHPKKKKNQKSINHKQIIKINY